MKMMKPLVVVGSLALALCIVQAPTAAQVQKAPPAKAAPAKAPAKAAPAKAALQKIAGVTDTSILVINGNRDHSTKITARVKDVIQINWALKASPPTTGVNVSSTNPAVVKVGAVRYLKNINGPTGAGGDIVVRFTAKQKGTSTLTWIIRRTEADFSVVACTVTVQ
jgi:hypothetical protein